MRIGITEMPENGFKITPLQNGNVEIELFQDPIETLDEQGNRNITANVFFITKKNFAGLRESILNNFDWYLKQAEKEQESRLTEQFTQIIQKWMDTTVHERGYDNIVSACTYADSADAIFAKEGKAAKIWRDKVWRRCYDIMAEIITGKRNIPTSNELLKELPKLEW